MPAVQPCCQQVSAVQRCKVLPARTVRCAADLQNRKVRAEPARVRIRTEAAGPSREGAPRAGSLAFCAKRPNRRHCDVRMLVSRESGYLSTGQRVRGYIGMGQ
jgi:hypothetical protein